MTAGAASASSDGVTRRDTEIHHEPCDTDSGSAEKLDVNGDGKPDVTIVRDGSREVCRAVDLNFDGVIDSYSYFDQAGQLRRRENDYDRDGQPDEISIYKAGVIAETYRATSTAHKLDSWDFYQAGTLVRAERDSDGDGMIDQWWEYSKPGCPLIHADMNGDGHPDPGATIDYCKETGYVPPERAEQKAPASPTFEQKGTLPTELENKEAGSKDSSSKDAEPASKPVDTTPPPSVPAAGTKGADK